MHLTTHCLTVFVGLDDDAAAVVPSWEPATSEDAALDQHAVHLIELRAAVDRTSL